MAERNRVNTAIGLLGDPQVIYLDEPTTGECRFLRRLRRGVFAGLDPESKRKIWDVICKLRDAGKCIVLTSHSMEECEALCTRVSIMVNGSFKCLGSIPHIKNKYAQDCSLTIRSNRDATDLDIAAIVDFVQQNFKGAVLKRKFHGLLTYRMPAAKSMTWPKIFGIMEKGKSELNMDDYSVGHPSLEEVCFTSFTQLVLHNFIIFVSGVPLLDSISTSGSCHLMLLLLIVFLLIFVLKIRKKNNRKCSLR